jgi:hypothetical protein
MNLTIKIVSLFTIIFFPWLLAACAASSPTSPTASPGLEGFFGRVYSASDVSTIPDTPLPGQVILALPAAEAGERLGASLPLSPTDLRFLKAVIREPHPGLSTALSGLDGAYSLPLSPGEYVLCLGESEGQPGEYPISIRGCGLASLPSTSAQQMNISSGFGEILLEPAR